MNGFDTCDPSGLVSPHFGSLALESCFPTARYQPIEPRKPPASLHRGLSTTKAAAPSVSCPDPRPEHIRSPFDVIAALTSCDYPRRDSFLRERASPVLSPNPVSVCAPDNAAGDDRTPQSNRALLDCSASSSRRLALSTYRTVAYKPQTTHPRNSSILLMRPQP